MLCLVNQSDRHEKVDMRETFLFLKISGWYLRESCSKTTEIIFPSIKNLMWVKFWAVKSIKVERAYCAV